MWQRGDRPEHTGRSDGAEQQRWVPRWVGQLPRGQTWPWKHRRGPRLGAPQGQPGEPTCPSTHTVHCGPGGSGDLERKPARQPPTCRWTQETECPCAHLGCGDPRTEGHRGPSFCAHPSHLSGCTLSTRLRFRAAEGQHAHCLSIHPLDLTPLVSTSIGSHRRCDGKGRAGLEPPSLHPIVPPCCPPASSPPP